MADDIELCLHTPRADCNCTTPSKPTPARSLPPHAPCRLQPMRKSPVARTLTFASTRPVQIATYEEIAGGANIDLCLHTPRADCNRDCAGEKSQKARLCLHTPRADCNASPLSSSILRMLCLHTPRADCNMLARISGTSHVPLPPHAPCRLQPRDRLLIRRQSGLCLHTPRADCNTTFADCPPTRKLCLHTPRADCNSFPFPLAACRRPLPPHAPCRLQPKEIES